MLLTKTKNKKNNYTMKNKYQIQKSFNYKMRFILILKIKVFKILRIIKKILILTYKKKIKRYIFQ